MPIKLEDKREALSSDLSDLEIEYNDVECLCSEWLLKMTSLTYLDLGLENNYIDNDGFILILNVLEKLVS